MRRPHTHIDDPARHVQRIAAIVLATLALAGPVSADEPALTLSKPVELPELSDESLIAIPLDADIYDATQDDLDDVRLLSSDGETVPFLLRKRQTTRDRVDRSNWPARDPSIRRLDGGGLQITITLAEDDPLPTGLRLVTPLRNFEQRIRVESSPDGAAWQPAGAETVIFDYSQYMDVRSDEVELPSTNDRHFRITIDDVTSELESQLIELSRQLQGDKESGRMERFTVERRPLRIDRIEFIRTVSRAQATGDERDEYPVDGIDVVATSEDNETIVTIGTRREPLTSFTIVTPSRNFSRSARVQVEHADGVIREWRTIGHGTLSQLDFAGRHREQRKIMFPETRQQRYRLVISNRDSPPLQIDGVVAEGAVYEVVAFAGPDAAYSLAYGDVHAEAPHYDVAALTTLLGSGVQPLTAQLGPAQPIQAAARPRKFGPADVLNHPAVLVGLVVVLVIALGWGLYRAARRVDSLPKDRDA